MYLHTVRVLEILAIHTFFVIPAHIETEIIYELINSALFKCVLMLLLLIDDSHTEADVGIHLKAGSFTVGHKEMLVPWILFALSWSFAQASLYFMPTAPTYVVNTP